MKNKEKVVNDCPVCHEFPANPNNQGTGHSHYHACDSCMADFENWCKTI